MEVWGPTSRRHFIFYYLSSINSLERENFRLRFIMRQKLHMGRKQEESNADKSISPPGRQYQTTLGERHEETDKKASNVAKHLCRYLLEVEPPARHIRKLVLDLKDCIQYHLKQSLDTQALNITHRQSVNTFLNSLSTNSVLRVKSLSTKSSTWFKLREYRVILAKLRCGYSSVRYT